MKMCHKIIKYIYVFLARITKAHFREKKKKKKNIE